MKRTAAWTLSIALAGVVLVVALIVVALNRSEGQTAAIDFMGEVESVTFGDGWEINGGVLGGGGPDSPITVGPQTVTLVGGDVLTVSSGTPGGNLCLELVHPEQVPEIAGEPSVTDVEEIPMYEGWWDWTIPCVVMGQVKDTGDVAWFQVLAVSEFDGMKVAEVGQAARIDFEQDTVVTSSGFRFNLRPDKSDCGEGLDDVAAMYALADWTSADVVGLRCAFAG